MAPLRRSWIRRVPLCCFLTLFAAQAAERGEGEARLRFLAAEIARHDDLYFRAAQPEIGDAEYDALKRELAELRARFPDVAAEVSGAGGLGDDRRDGFRKQPHRERMLGLEKVYSEAELAAWFERAKRAVGDESVTVVIEPKYDGLAVAATYERGRLLRVLTRGNGDEGDDVTENVRQFCSLPETLDVTKAAVPEIVEVRGEVFMTLAEFDRINRGRVENGETEFASPRNLAAGTLKLLAGDRGEARRLEIVFFGVGGWTGDAEAASHRELVQRLRAWGLPVARLTATADSFQAASRIVREWERARATWPYPTDGVVLKIDSRAAQRTLGVARDAPRWAVAFKFSPERVATRLRAIRIQVGRSGVLTPVAELDPVQLGGSTVARASLHNADEIARRDLRVGDYVFVERAGEVVPRIVGVDLARRGADVRPFVFPERCPVCEAAIERREGEVARRCPSLSCPAQLKARLRHFVSARAAGIRGLGPATIDALVDAGKLTSVADLYVLRVEEIMAATRLRGATAEALIAAIAESRGVELSRVVHGLGLPGVGAIVAKHLAARFGSLAAIAGADATELREVEGLGTAAAEELAAYLRRQDVQRELRELHALLR